MPDLAPLADRAFGAVLFDMDGTLISSIASAERVWSRWAKRHGLDPAALLPTIHGVQAVETIRRLALPGVDPVAEAEALTRAEIDDVDGILPIPRASAFLASLPPERWAVVTSAPRLLARRRLEAAGMPHPAILIAAEDVARSKPAPDGFRLGAERLGVGIADCLVFEDSPAGIQAAIASGAALCVVTATHAGHMPPRHAWIRDYRDLDACDRPDGTIGIAPPATGAG